MLSVQCRLSSLFQYMDNLIVMTFTAARVKQEIAKEGILPESLLFANTTPTAKLLAHIRVHSHYKDNRPSF